MSGKPPASAEAKVNSLLRAIESLDAMWSIQDALCDEALMEGTKEGDQRAQVHYDQCMKLNAQRSEFRNQIDNLREAQAQRKEKQEAARLPKKEGGRTRRRMRKSKTRRQNKSRK